MRPAINLPIHWLLVEDGESINAPLEAVVVGNQLLLTSVNSNNNSMDFTHKKYTLNDKELVIDNEGDSVAIQAEKGLKKMALSTISKSRVLLVYTEDFTAEVTYLSAAFRALSNYLNLELELIAVNDEKEIEAESFDILVWLKASKPISFSGKKLLWQPDELAFQLIEKGLLDSQYLLKDHLNAENTVDDDLVQQLIPLFDLHQHLPADLEAYDRRTMKGMDIVAPLVSENKPALKRESEDVSPWLWGFLLFVIPVERILSKYRKQ